MIARQEAPTRGLARRIAAAGVSVIELAFVASLTFAAGSDAPAVAQETGPVPGLTVDPVAGRRGSAITLTGTSCCYRDETPATTDVTTAADGGSTVTWTVTMSDVAEDLGSVVDHRDPGERLAHISGDVDVPLAAAEGRHTLHACAPADVIDVVKAGNACVGTPFVVLPPTLSIAPAEAEPGDVVTLRGEGWCCAGSTGPVSEAGTQQLWATANVDELGGLLADVVVPDLPAGPVRLWACIDDRCRAVGFTVLPSTPTRSTSTTAPGTNGGSTTTRGSTTTGGRSSGEEQGTTRETDDPPGSGDPNDPGDGGGSSETDTPGTEGGPAADDGRTLGPAAIVLVGATGLVGVACAVVAAVLVHRGRTRLGRRPRPQRSRPRRPDARPRLAVRPGQRRLTVQGPDGPVPTISVVLDPTSITTRIRERQLR